jgi:hypothetical protein
MPQPKLTYWTYWMSAAASSRPEGTLKVASYTGMDTV